MPGHGLVMGWAPSCGEDAPFLQRLWPVVLRSAAGGGGLRVDAEILDTVLAPCARDCLNSRKRRQELSAAFTPMLEAAQNPQEAAAALLAAALDYHDQQLATNGGVCRLGKYHNVLYVTASLAVEHSVEDSHTVARLLLALHGCEGGLDRLLAPALLGPKVSHILSSWRPDCDTAEEARHHLQFFLGHARATRLVLPQPGGPPLPLLDAPLPTLQGASPLYVAVQATDEDAVLLLMQNGARVSLGGELCPLLLALRRLSTHARATIGLMDPCNCPVVLCPCFFTLPIQYPPEEVGVLRLLLRALGTRSIEMDPEVVHPRILTDGLLGGPPSLAHWARHSIRGTLAQCWALPHGTAALSMPDPVVDYLNLLRD